MLTARRLLLAPTSAASAVGFAVQTRRVCLALAFATLLLLGKTLSAADPPVADAPPKNESFGELHDLYYGAHLNINRERSRKLDLVEEMLRDERFGEALPWLQELLETPDDVLRELAPRDDLLRSVKQQCRELLRTLPPAGRESYELQFGARAKRELATALESHDSQKLALVALRYSATKAGTLALWLWAQAEADRGRMESAERIRELLAESPAGGAEAARKLKFPAGANFSLESAVIDAGLPHAWPQWQAALLASPQQDARWRKYAANASGRSLASCPAAAPLSVGEYLAIRTPTELVLCDRRSGLRVAATELATLIDSVPAYSQDDWAYQRDEVDDPLIRQLRFNKLALGLTTDGQRIFAIEAAKPRSRDKSQSSLTANQGFFGGEEGWESPTNCLTALVVGPELKPAWRADGSAAGPFKGAYFLGPPLSVDGRLFVQLEWRQTIQLAELNAATGELLWKQPLVNIERGVSASPRLRMLGVRPVFANGLLLCPTGAGLVVAVDVVQQQLAWVYRFPLARDDRNDRSPQAWQQQLAAERGSSPETGWQESRLIVAGERVIIASPESSAVHCVDRNTGRLIWESTQESAALVVGVADQAVVLAEPTGLRAIELRDAATRWRAPFTAGETLSGRGLIAREQALVPTSANTLLAVNLADGAIERLPLVDLPEPLGNLVWGGDALYSQSGAQLVRLDESRRLLASAEAALAKNPQDSAARCVRGEAALIAGDISGATDEFRRALSATPTDTVAQQRLGLALLSAIRAGAQLSAAEESQLRQLLRDPVARSEFDTWRFRWAHQRGDFTAAVAIACDVASAPAANDELLDITRSHQALRSRWIAASLGELGREADERQQAEAESKLSEQLANLNVDALPVYAQLFAELPAGAELRGRYRDLLMERGRSLEATLLGDLPSPNASQPNSPQSFELATRWAQQQIAVKLNLNTRGSTSGERSSRGPRWKNVIESRQSQVGPLPKEQGGICRWSISRSGDELVGWNTFGEPLWTGNLSGRYANGGERETTAPNLWRLGKLVFFDLGAGAIAIDTTAGSAKPLWNSAQQLGAERRFPFRLRGTRRNVVIDAPPGSSGEGQRQFLADVSPLAVVLAERNRLQALDPLTGNLLWERTGISTERIARAGDVLFVCDGQGAGSRLSLRDGRTLSAWQAPSGEWVELFAGRVATRNSSKRDKSLSIHDLATEKELLKIELAPETNLLCVAPGEVLCHAPDGKLTLIDLPSVSARFEQPTKLLPAEKLAECVVEADRYYVITQQEVDGESLALDGESLGNGPMINGEMLAIDRSTGVPLWSQPAKLVNAGLLKEQPPASPLLLFASRLERAAVGGNLGYAQVSVIEKSSGRLVYQKQDLPDASVGDYNLHVEQGAAPQVHFEFGESRLVFKLTETPAPPEPVADLGLAARSRESGVELEDVGRGLERIFDAAIVPGEQDDD